MAGPIVTSTGGTGVDVVTSRSAEVDFSLLDLSFSVSL